MKKRLQGVVVGVLIGAMLTSGAVFAKQISETAELIYNNIKISMNGQEILPKDANGNYVEPFTINGTTYLPVRAVANALKIDVDWDGSTSTVILSNALTAPFTLAAGQYIVGEDIAAGKYDCSAVSGSGNFTGTVESLGFMGLNEILAEEGHEFFKDQVTYSNLRLKDGDIIKIGGDLKVEFIKK
ncbi:MAG: copper amine oxidase N-terminal domain-containing protein [Ruminococcaceae bacterium]|nr:copper amine oxidase N-terminal domain-containing protein [Oscillospiraceae bacterium]